MFKKGDKVKVVSSNLTSYWYSDRIGQEFTLDGVDKANGPFIIDFDNDRCYFDECNIELVKEEKEVMQFDMNKEAWFIRVANEHEFNAARDWIKSKGFDFMFSDKWYLGCTGIAHNSGDGAEVYRLDETDDADLHYEVKPSFKTVVDSVTFPEVKTELQKEIEELEKIILIYQTRKNLLLSLVAGYDLPNANWRYDKRAWW